MTILALEFSSLQRSVAVLGTAGAAIAAEVVETGGRGTNAFGMIERALAEAKIEREQIETIAVGLGPGSYTGVRAAISVAQGWQLARGVKLAGIGSVECLAAQARAGQIFGRVNIVVDAQRNEIYRAGYDVSADGWQEIEPLKILPAADMSATARGDARPTSFIGPEVTRWFTGGRVIFPRAATLAELASRRSHFVPGENLQPIYLRETSFVKAPPSRIIA
jgi:tRNA threonylcarbamoyl adenosine modification protein YeaZ